jgi:hypothetical protein
MYSADQERANSPAFRGRSPRRVAKPSETKLLRPGTESSNPPPPQRRVACEPDFLDQGRFGAPGGGGDPDADLCSKRGGAGRLLRSSPAYSSAQISSSQGDRAERRRGGECRRSRAIGFRPLCAKGIIGAAMDDSPILPPRRCPTCGKMIRANSGEPNGSAAPGLPILDRLSDDLKADAVD